MTERYTRLFTLDSQYYQDNSPVVIIAGALLKDTVKNSILAQLKYKSISNKVINALKVSIQARSITGESLGGPVKYQYLDLHINRDEEFGQKEPVELPDNNTRKFTVNIVEVVFSDDTIWHADSVECEDFSNAVLLEEGLNSDPELVKQYKLKFGEDSRVIPEAHKQFWICACGGMNHNEEERCHLCGKEVARLIPLNMDELEEEKTFRLNDQKYGRAMSLMKQDSIDDLNRAKEILTEIPEWKDSKDKIQEIENRIVKLTEQLQRQAIIDEKNKIIAAEKRKKRMMIGSGIALVLVMVAALLIFVILPNNHSKKGDQLLAEGRFDEAITEYEAANNKDKLEEANYQKALSISQNGETDNAVAIIKELEGNSTISQERIIEAYYAFTIAYMDHGQYEKALSLIDVMGDYKDADDLRIQCNNGKIIDEIKQNISGRNYQSAFNQLKELKESNTVNIDNLAYQSAISFYKAAEFELGDQTISLVDDKSVVNQNEIDEIIKSYLEDKILSFKIKDNGVFMLGTYIERSFALVNGNELENVLTGHWQAHTGSNHYNDFYFNSDGTCFAPGKTNHIQNWSIDGDKLILSYNRPDGMYVRKVDDSHYLLCEGKSNNMWIILYKE